MQAPFRSRSPRGDPGGRGDPPPPPGPLRAVANAPHPPPWAGRGDTQTPTPPFPSRREPQRPKPWKPKSAPLRGFPAAHPLNAPAILVLGGFSPRPPGAPLRPSGRGPWAPLRRGGGGLWAALKGPRRLGFGGVGCFFHCKRFFPVGGIFPAPPPRPQGRQWPREARKRPQEANRGEGGMGMPPAPLRGLSGRLWGLEGDPHVRAAWGWGRTRPFFLI